MIYDFIYRHRYIRHETKEFLLRIKELFPFVNFFGG
jgi:hypothetical protein